MKRRDFIKSIGIGAAAYTLPNMVYAAKKETVDRSFLTVFDNRYPETKSFGRALASSGQIVPFTNDISTVWFSHIKPTLEGNKEVLGISRPAELFVLEQLLMGEGKRISFRSHHTYHKNGIMKHRIPSNIFVSSRGLNRSFDWSGYWAEEVMTKSTNSVDQFKEIYTSHSRPENSPEEYVIWRIS